MDPSTLRARADEVLEHHEAGDIDAALAACDQLLADVEQLASDPIELDHPVVRETLFAARFERALLLTERGDLAGAAEAYAVAAATPADLDDPDQRHEVAMSQLNRGVCLDAIGDHEQALDAYDLLIAEHADARDPVTRDQVTRARVNRASTLLAIDRPLEATMAATELAEQLDPSDALDAEQLAMVVRIQAAALRAMDRVEEAAAALGAIERVSHEDPAARSQVAIAIRERAEALAELGRAAEAIALLDAAIDRFRDDPDPVVIEVVDDLVAAEVSLKGVSGQPRA